LLAGHSKSGEWLTAEELVDRYLGEEFRPRVIDLSGGEPGLTPELVVWFMKALRKRQLDGITYLWTDDNLSTDFYWRCLSKEDRGLVATYPNFGKVACFKGFTQESFSFNTGASPGLFEQQFSLMKRWLRSGIDMYAYCTFTTPTAHGIDDDMHRFVDRLQSLSPSLPLRTVPLRIVEFTPVKRRLDPARADALKHQWRAVEAWKLEIGNRFSSEERSKNIATVQLDP
jgi:uncharacterized Fe-S cluster-containing radical SAM superfamily protein